MRTWSPSGGAVAKIFVPTRNEVRSKRGDPRSPAGGEPADAHRRGPRPTSRPCQEVGEVGRAGDDMCRGPRLEGRRVLRTRQHADDEGDAGVGARLESRRVSPATTPARGSVTPVSAMACSIIRGDGRRHRPARRRRGRHCRPDRPLELLGQRVRHPVGNPVVSTTCTPVAEPAHRRLDARDRRRWCREVGVVDGGRSRRAPHRPRHRRGAPRRR